MSRCWRLALSLGVVALTGCGGNGNGGNGGPPGPVTIGIDPWTIPPGTDHIWCKNMKVPSASTLDVSTFHITMNQGSHHFILYRSSASLPDGFGDCGDMSGLTFVTGSQTPDFSYSYPTGLAMPLFAGEQLVLQSHYVNASTSSIQGKVTVEMTTIPHSQVTNYVQTFLAPDTSFSIPPQTPATPGYTDGGQDVPETSGYNILSVSSHMHKRGVHFTIDETPSGGSPTRLFDTTQWHAPPVITFSPPRPTSSSNTLHYQCTWMNETTHPVVFGYTTEDEMCIMVITIFPAVSYHP